jgi:SOS-response transcriptional repressor LexA
MGLTPRQRECLDFIRAEVREKGIVPSYDEISRTLGNTTRSATPRLIEGLEDRGYLRRTSYLGKKNTRRRGLKLVYSEYDHRPNVLDCPCPRCPARRIQYEQLIQGLQSDPKFGPGVRLSGIGLRFAPGTTIYAAPRTRKTALPQGAC